MKNWIYAAAIITGTAMGITVTVCLFQNDMLKAIFFQIGSIHLLISSQTIKKD